MPRYLIQVSYVEESAHGLLRKERARRREELARIVESLGGRFEAVYFAPGDRSAYAFVEIPDTESAVAATMLLRASRAGVGSTAVLRMPEKPDQAALLLDDRPPGRERE